MGSDRGREGTSFTEGLREPGILQSAYKHHPLNNATSTQVLLSPLLDAEAEVKELSRTPSWGE